MKSRNFIDTCHLVIGSIFAMMLIGCLEEEKVPLSYSAINRTANNIVAIAVNDEGGVLNASAQSGGGDAVCCVLVPRNWRSGLSVKISWQEGGRFLRDAKGNVVKEDGVPVVIESPWKSKVVEIPPYPKELGDFYIVFFPNDEIRIAIKNGYPTEILPKDDPLQPERK